MKALILNGFDNEEVLEYGMVEDLEAVLRAVGWDAETIVLRELDIAGCLGCFGCWIKTPGKCVIDDPGREMAERFIGADLVVFLTPVTFGGYSYHLKKALDRFIPLISPFFTKVDGETHHAKRYESYPRLVGMGVLDLHDESGERIFRGLVARNAINMYSPAFSSGIILRTEGRERWTEVVTKTLDDMGVRP